MNEPSSKPINIYHFSDYRAFLNAYLIEKKKRKAPFSIRGWCQKLGFKSPATLNMILRGKRDPGPEAVDSFVRYFGFTHNQKEYFENLVRLTKTQRDPARKARTLETLRKLHPEKKIDLIDFDTFETISNWYFFALQEMTQSEDFREDPEWLSKKLRRKVTPKKIDDALKTLLRAGLLARHASGKLTTTRQHVTTPADISNEAIRRFHEQMSALAKEAIREAAPEERDFGASTFNIDPKDLPALKADLRQARREIYQRYEKPQATATYQLNIQLFPLTQEMGVTK